ncbi:MAG: hypothetical protein OXI59_10250, partial [Gemmatimonadota bacterium]|nr:hypothetical protein [Gemmatimonadota bacterium]
PFHIQNGTRRSAAGGLMKFLRFILVYVSTGLTDICNYPAVRANTGEFNLAFPLFALRAWSV